MTRTADPKKAPPVPADVERYLEKLGLPPEMRAYAKYLYPDPNTETEAQQLEREREQAQRVERLRTLSELVRQALGGRDAALKVALRQALADGSKSRTEQLEQCGRILEKRRAAQRQAQQQGSQRGRFAP